MRARRSSLAVGVASLASAAGLVLGLALVTACGAAAPVGEGGTCALVGDCAAGLVCVPKKNGTRTCSSDISGTVAVPSSPSADGGATADDGGATDDGGSTDDGGTTTDDSGTPPVVDGGTPPVVDAGTPPVVDAGAPKDAGTTPKDAGAPPRDAGSSDGG